MDADRESQLGPEQFLLTSDGATASLTLTGEFDDFNADGLDAGLTALLATPVRTVDIDSTRVTYLSSTALRALIAFHDAATRQGTAVRISRALYVVRRLIEVVGLSAMFGLGRSADG
jgi:anti-anti-sigma factor